MKKKMHAFVCIGKKRAEQNKNSKSKEEKETFIMFKCAKRLQHTSKYNCLMIHQADLIEKFDEKKVVNFFLQYFISTFFRHQFSIWFDFIGNSECWNIINIWRLMSHQNYSVVVFYFRCRNSFVDLAWQMCAVGYLTVRNTLFGDLSWSLTFSFSAGWFSTTE